MKAVLRFLTSGIGVTIIVGIVLSAALWLVGGFIGFGDARPFATVFGRLVGLAVLWLLLLLIILLILLRGNRKDEALAEDVVAAPAAGGAEDEAVTEELSELRGKLRAALKMLRRSKRGRVHLYELPWYIIVGPPGAGKTTAIVNSGLHFPLADEMGTESLAGVGGTRNCDWWFTDEAVLVDTAGRYTTQESDAELDNAAWLGFLSILKKHRRRQPINGAVVAISLSDLSNSDEITQMGHARAVRRRLGELREKLGIRFPVYVMFTKADLVAGFTEFFDHLGKEERGQVWGFTLPLIKGRATESPVASFDAEFDALLERLNAQMLERLQSETDPGRRALIAGFPAQVASLRPVARAFLEELFQESRFEHRQFLRGVYFTSGTQEGAPIDRLMMGMARTFGIGRQAIGTGRGTGRSYFLTRLFTGVMFPEAGLVSADDRVERRVRWTRRGAYAAALAAVAAMGTVWTMSYLNNRAMAAEVSDGLRAYRETAEAIPPSPVADSDVTLVVPALNTLRDLPAGPASADEGVPDGHGWGLYQGRVLADEARITYREALNQHFLPRLLWRLEDQMQGSVNHPELLYEALKIYLMLGLAGPMNTAQVKDWMAADWAYFYPGASRADLRADLEIHLDALLSQPMEKIALNADLVDKVREVLTQMPQAQRVYTGITESTAARSVPTWRLDDVITVDNTIVRSSGRPLSEGVPGIYTFTGFHDVFLPEAEQVAARLQRDSWVLGPDYEIEAGSAELDALTEDVLGLYYTDYIRHYQEILGDLDVIPMDSLGNAATVTNALAGPNSPIVAVLEEVAAQTSLTRLPEPAEAEDGGDSAVGTALERQATQAAGRVGGNLGRAALRDAQRRADGGGPAPTLPGEPVEQRFAWLHDLVASEGDRPSRLGAVVARLQDVARELNALSIQRSPTPGPELAATLAAFKDAASQEEGPLQRWAAQIVQGASGISAEGTRASINAAWRETGAFCAQATDGRFPFDRRSKADIPIADFGELFGFGGRIDRFIDETLAEHVNMGTTPWRWQSAGETDLGISDAVLLQMQRAREIRDTFFRGGTTPDVTFEIVDGLIPRDADAVELEIHGQTVSMSPRRKPEGRITWPGSVGVSQVAFSPLLQNSESVLRYDGAWAWFRMMDAARINRGSAPDRRRLLFQVGPRAAVFEMQLGSVRNPFALEALEQFSCPQTF